MSQIVVNFKRQIITRNYCLLKNFIDYIESSNLLIFDCFECVILKFPQNYALAFDFSEMVLPS